MAPPSHIRDRPRPAGYTDRWEAGHRLADHLGAYTGRADVVVLGLPRGGVVTAAAVAERLKAPLDVFCVRKLGVPWHSELAMGAVATGGVRVLNDDVVAQLDVSPEEIEEVSDRELAELTRRERVYRGERPPLDITGRVAICVDDGLATGATARAAVQAIRRSDPARVVFAVPVGPSHTVVGLSDLVDDVVCPLTPERFDAVGRWYSVFEPTTDAEVRRLLGL